MATGTSAGLLDAQGAQSLFKHKLLGSYLTPFVMMTGSTADRVVVVDGYAGRGIYPDGTLGSAGLMLAAARRSVNAGRHVDVVLVEKDATNVPSLQTVAARFAGGGLSAAVHPGAVEQYVEQIVAAAAGVPAFVLLDPTGAVLPWDGMQKLLAARRNPSLATELLINFSSHLNRRVGGRLVKGQLDQSTDTTHDQIFGDTSWREAASQAYARGGYQGVDQAIVELYAARIRTALGGTVHTFAVPVAKHHGRKPEYHLLYVTRRTHGVWVFADAVARARIAWQHALEVQPTADDVGQLFTTADIADLEKARAAKEITDNLRRLAGDHEQVRLREHTAAVFGSWFGSATESAVTTAVRSLIQSGELVLVENAAKLRDRVYGRGPRQLDARTGI